MKLAILKVILWPKNTSLEPREIKLEPGMINIITGESAAGKSTITAIIDYCLGSDKCSIPVGLIRDVTEWFGLHLQLANTEMIVARRNPEEQQSTTDLFWTEGVHLDVPHEVDKNARVDDLKHRFNQLACLPSLELSSSDDVGYGSRPSFRDMAAFNFQPQHIVANPFTLFYKADTTEHREKLRVIFPFVLGAVTVDTLLKQRELKEAEKEYEKSKRELDARLSAARVWEAEIESYYMQARSYGLLSGANASANWSLDDYILELKKVPELVSKLDIPDVHEGANEGGVNDLTQLINEEDNIAQEMGRFRRRLEKIDQLNSTVNDYHVSLTGQKDRMQGVGWLSEKFKAPYVCPVCATTHASENPHLVELQKLASELGSLTAAVQQAPAKLDKELVELRQQLAEREVAISKIRQKRRFLESCSEALAAKRQEVRQIYLFIGRIEQALENVRSSRNVGDLKEKVSVLAGRVAILKKELDPYTQRARLNAAIEAVSSRIAYYAKELRLEHAEENVGINVKELTLQFKRLSGRTDFLWEVGSGQNWVGYHAAGLLALHEFFAKLTNNPVPQFLVIDQPSQVYFPEAWPSIDHAPGGSNKFENSTDIAGVHRIFEALSLFLDCVSCQFQIIVTEHAGAITWDKVPHVHLVGNWRKGHDEFLIPESWLQHPLLNSNKET